jgi:DNA-binding NarL/FixJ family response regulator
VIELSNPETAIEPVTEREMDVLQSIARGLSNKQIALELGISEHTVKFHLSALYAKLGATNRTEAVRIGTQRGLIVL